MLLIGNIVVSEDIVNEYFVCDLPRCKGACCLEGIYGAPLENGELKILEEIYPLVKPYLTEAGRNAIRNQGTSVPSYDGKFATTLIRDAECAYSRYEKNGVLKCAIEEAYFAGQVNFQKPISCHLYPIRITKNDKYEFVNYDRWEICDSACKLGKKQRVPVYQFLKEPLIRKYGAEWYAQLAEQIEKESKLV